jgi:RNA 2',3'-cyclic 3'-phosphodiesterase
MNWRLFVAVELPAGLKDALARTRDSLRADVGNRVRWSDPQGIHLTLKFLGDTDERRVPGLNRAIDDACSVCASFTVGLAGLGCFPDWQRPRVLWVGLQGQLEELGRLQARVDAALAGLGFPREERAFTAHLTLGRVGDGMTATDRQRLASAMRDTPAPPPALMLVREVSLMRSQLMPGGARYSRLYAASLTR